MTKNKLFFLKYFKSKMLGINCSLLLYLKILAIYSVRRYYELGIRFLLKKLIVTAKVWTIMFSYIKSIFYLNGRFFSVEPR